MHISAKEMTTASASTGKYAFRQRENASGPVAICARLMSRFSACGKLRLSSMKASSSQPTLPSVWLVYFDVAHFPPCRASQPPLTVLDAPMAAISTGCPSRSLRLRRSAPPMCTSPRSSCAGDSSAGRPNALVVGTPSGRGGKGEGAGGGGGGLGGDAERTMACVSSVW